MGFIETIKREVKYIRSAKRMLDSVKDVSTDSTTLVPDNIEAWVDKHSNNIAFIEDEREWTYTDFDNYANRVANWAVSKGCKPGDTVAIFAQDRLEYVALWFGLSKVGVIPALLNYQLAGPALAHCVNISDVKALIMDAEIVEAWETARTDVKDALDVYAAFGDVDGYPSFDAELSDIAPHRPSKEGRKGITGGDLCMKMFTSGTTGMPKSAKVSHNRAQFYMRGMGAGINAQPTDRMMMVLPLYHATGGLCGVGIAISKGGAVIVRRKFSKSKFWDECVHFKATLFMYVGEICRFLLNAPAHPNEAKHSLRWIIGNGLRPEVWSGFVSRFNIPHVMEFYGATEGNVSLLNIDGPIGAVGRVPGYLRSRFNCDIIRYDVETNTNVRSSDGFCIRVEPEEVGELIGEIRADSARFKFDGYETKEATEKKILRNVFKKGDMWFRTGDLMKKDNLDYFYFIDRVGDTFRWKAENVATGEVAAALSKFDGITQANVYGVQVPGYDGRAGMASIISEAAPDLEKLREHLEASLPHYARPVFLRLSQESDVTGTFKFKKTNLVKAGFNPANIDEPVYVFDGVSGKYIQIDEALYKKIEAGDMRL